MSRNKELRAFVDGLGRARLMAALGLNSPAALTNAISAGGLPPGWFAAIEHLCQQDGRPVPKDLFKWRAPAP